MSDNVTSLIARRFLGNPSNWQKGSLHAGEEQGKIDEQLASGKISSDLALSLMDMPMIFTPEGESRVVDKGLYPSQEAGYFIKIPDELAGAVNEELLAVIPELQKGRDPYTYNLDGEKNTPHHNLMVSANVYEAIMKRCVGQEKKT